MAGAGANPAPAAPSFLKNGGLPKGGFRAPGVPLLPVASIVACVWLMLNLTGLTWIRFLIWMAIGVLIYFAYGRTHSVLALRESATSAR